MRAARTKPGTDHVTQWMTTAELAEHFRCSQWTVRRRAKEGVWPAHYVSDTHRAALFDVAECERALREMDAS